MNKTFLMIPGQTPVQEVLLAMAKHLLGIEAENFGNFTRGLCRFKMGT